MWFARGINSPDRLTQSHHPRLQHQFAKAASCFDGVPKTCHVAGATSARSLDVVTCQVRCASQGIAKPSYFIDRDNTHTAPCAYGQGMRRWAGAMMHTHI
eukprot:31121-Chlamydomonas_euryale.AAC.2